MRRRVGVLALGILAAALSLAVVFSRLEARWQVDSASIAFGSDRVTLVVEATFSSRHGIDVARCDCDILCSSFRYEASLVERNVTGNRGRFTLEAIERPANPRPRRGKACAISCDALLAVDLYHTGVRLRTHRHARLSARVKGGNEVAGQVVGVSNVSVERPALLRSEVNTELNFPPNIEGLVLGCIDADFCK